MLVISNEVGQGSGAGNDSSKSRAVSQVIKEGISSQLFGPLAFYFCMLFFDNATQTMIDEVAPWTLTLWPKSKTKNGLRMKSKINFQLITKENRHKLALIFGSLEPTLTPETE